jgi:dTDP-4-dehydrorhamnose 3,5-epimerase-like enzyme
MTIEQKKINFEDERGTIMDIFSNVSIEHATIIHSKKGSVRGNHYHKETVQMDFIVSGQIRILSQKVGEEKITEAILNANDLIVHQPSEAHTMIALEDTIFVTFAKGLRGGEQYESDTFRLVKPLQEQIKDI